MARADIFTADTAEIEGYLVLIEGSEGSLGIIIYLKKGFTSL
jgi:hypothetical protein